MAEKNSPSQSGYLIWYIIVAVVFAMIILNARGGPDLDKIAYSEFLRLLDQGRVAEVTIGNELITGRLTADVGGEEEGRFVTVPVNDPRLVEKLQGKGVTYSGHLSNTKLITLFSWLFPILLLLGFWTFLSRRMRMGGSALSFGATKAKIYAENEIQVTFEDVAGVDEAEEELVEIVEFLKTPQKFLRLGGKIPKGVLLVGPPGTGKTLLAKAVAGEARVPFFSISGSEFVEMFVGVGAARVRDLFTKAETRAPCIIFIDELDALGKVRGANPLAGNDEREQTLNQLLVEMDGFDSSKGVIILAATNRPDVLDPALLRAGRFDRQVLVDRPDLKGREAILRIHTKNVRLGPEVDQQIVAARTPGFAGADLANIVNEAALLAARKGKAVVELEDFDEAIDRVIAGLEKKSRVMNRKEKEIIAIHECGHALVAEVHPESDPVHKISIIPRGITALGYTIQRPTEDRYLMTRSELLNKLYILLGGRVAEELVFNETSTGAQNDLQKSTDIARAMVKKYGMSDKLGLVAFEDDGGPGFLPQPFPTSKDYSEETAREIDTEVKAIIDEAHEKVRALIKEHRDQLLRLSKALLEHETLEGDEIREILRPPVLREIAPGEEIPSVQAAGGRGA